MIKKIKKLKNWYGIKCIENPEAISENTVIYAQNGTMKSSFAKGFADIVEGNEPEDRFSHAQSEYEIELDDGEKITNASPEIQGIIVFPNQVVIGNANPEKLVSNLRSLLADPKLQTKYQNKLDEIKTAYSSAATFSSIAATGKSKMKKEVPNIIDLLFSVNSKTVFDSDPAITTFNLLKLFYDILNDDDNKATFNEDINLLDIFNEKTIEWFVKTDGSGKKNEEFCKIIKTCAKEYKHVQDRINNQLPLRIGSNISIDNLSNINASLTKNNFYLDKTNHKICFAPRTIINSQESFNELYKQIQLEIFNDPKFHASYSTFDKIAGRNKATRDVRDLIASKSWIWPYLEDPISFAKKIIYAKLIKNKDEINENYKEITSKINEIHKILEEAKECETTWSSVIKTFNERFLNNIFKFEIQGKEQSVLNPEFSYPILVEKRKDTNVELDPDTFVETLSEGEKKSLMFLHLIYSIEVAKKQNIKTTIIFDDVLDSFDYKNKYAILSYLSEIISNPNFNLITLTHNFDFFRSLVYIYKVSHKPLADIWAIKRDNGAIFLNDNSKQQFQNWQYISDWKNKHNKYEINFKRFVALVPFCRNVYQIKSGIDSQNYISLCDFVHFVPDRNIRVDNATNEYKEIFNIDIEKHFGSNKNKNFIDELDRICENVLSARGVSQTLQMEFLDKMFLAAWIRIFSEKMLYLFWKNKTKPNDPEIKKTHNLGTGKMINFISTKLNDFEDYKESEVKAVYDKTKIIAPPFSHVNSFMFEPLIDINTNELIDCVKRIKKQIKVLVS